MTQQIILIMNIRQGSASSLCKEEGRGGVLFEEEKREPYSRCFAHSRFTYMTAATEGKQESNIVKRGDDRRGRGQGTRTA